MQLCSPDFTGIIIVTLINNITSVDISFAYVSRCASIKRSACPSRLCARPSPLSTMQDLFEDALGEVEFELVQRATSALSQATTASTELIDDSDDDVGKAVAPPTPQPLPRKRLPATGPVSDTKRRKRPHRQQLKLTEVDAANGYSIACIFVPVKKTTAAAPLWPQYVATWKDADFNGTTWIIVSNYERWVQLLVDAVTNRSVRTVAKALLDTARGEIHACITKARSALSQGGDTFSDSDDDCGGKPAAGRGKTTAAAIDIIVGGFTVGCMNTKRQILLKVDERTTAFLVGWVVPLAREFALSQADVDDAADTTATTDSPSKLASFHFSASPTPNIRDKVSWNPREHRWALKVVKPQGDVLVQELAVDPSLGADDYNAEKALAYGRAVEAWNPLMAAPVFVSTWRHRRYLRPVCRASERI